MKNLTKWLGLAALAAIVAAGIYIALREQPALVDTAPVMSGPMTVTIDQEGTTRVRNVYTVSAPIAGHLDRTSLEEGDPVEANKTIVASIHPLDPPLIDRRTEAELLAAIEAARSGVAQAELEHQRALAALELAKADLERATRLFGSNIVSERDMQRAATEVALKEAQVKTTEARIRQRQAELTSARARLMRPGDEVLDIAGRQCCVEVTAPIDGIVLSVKVKSEQAVSAGTPLAEVGNPEDLEIAVDLLSEDAVRIRPGLKAEITNWGGERNLSATVRRVDPSAFTKISALGIEEQRVNAVLDLDEFEPLLGHGYRVFARLAIWKSDDVLQVPIAALFRTDGEWAVYRADNDRASLTTIEIGHLNDESAEVISGLKSGDQVILHPSDLLEDGSLIALRNGR
ncbi:MAG: efflux RND transporter periplasmic adaptor subunit [Rhizobiaceae bacterium]